MQAAKALTRVLWALRMSRAGGVPPRAMLDAAPRTVDRIFKKVDPEALSTLAAALDSRTPVADQATIGAIRRALLRIAAEDDAHYS